MKKQELSLFDELGIERKKLQEEGKLPKWVTTNSWQMIKEKNLSQEYPDLESIYRRIARHAASYMKNSLEWEEKFYE